MMIPASYERWRLGHCPGDRTEPPWPSLASAARSPVVERFALEVAGGRSRKGHRHDITSGGGSRGVGMTRVTRYTRWRRSRSAVGSGRLLVGGEVGDGGLEVGVVGQGVQARGVEAAVAHQLGDHDDVDAGAQQVGAEGVPQGVRGGERLARLVQQVGVGGEFVEELVDGAGGEPAAAAVEDQRPE
jgi:hypothetical protein